MWAAYETQSLLHRRSEVWAGVPFAIFSCVISFKIALKRERFSFACLSLSLIPVFLWITKEKKSTQILPDTYPTPWEWVNRCWQPCSSEQTLNSISVSFLPCLRQRSCHTSIRFISACFKAFSPHGCLDQHMCPYLRGCVVKETHWCQRALCVSALRWRGD